MRPALSVACAAAYARTRLQLVALLTLIAAPIGASAGALTFEQAFGDDGEPAYVHYRTVFVVSGAEHQLEVWRDHDRRVKRRTDGAIETYATRVESGPEFRMSILDRERRIHTRVDRSNLYRIGSFADWFDLAHGLRQPAGPYRLVASAAPTGAPRPIEACRWFDLTQEAHTTHICWSTRHRLPLLLQSRSGTVQWRVVEVDTRPIPASTFEIHDDGFVQNDANQDIERD